MPYGRCPVCEAVYHMSVGLPVDEWYRQHWPQLGVGDEVPGLCPRCWMDLRPGHRVTVRTPSREWAEQIPVGTPGVVTAVEAGGVDGGPVYVVELEGAKAQTGRFRRADLHYVLGQPPPA